MKTLKESLSSRINESALDKITDTIISKWEVFTRDAKETLEITSFGQTKIIEYNCKEKNDFIDRFEKDVEKYLKSQRVYYILDISANTIIIKG